MANGNIKRKVESLDKHIGQCVRKRRIELGLSRNTLGEKLAVTHQQLGKYEDGINRISAHRLYEIAQALDVDISFFYKDAGSVKEPDNHYINGDDERILEDNLFTRQVTELNCAFRRIKDPSSRRTIISLVKSLAQSE